MSDFIKVFPDMIPVSTCAALIEMFDNSGEVTPNMIVDEQGVDVADGWRRSAGVYLSVENCGAHLATMERAFQTAYGQYVNAYPILKTQKTILPERFNLIRYAGDEEYYDWHLDGTDPGTRFRYVSQVAYLNSVPEGGETEFREQNQLIRPVQGSILMFPSGWTHEHRGRPPVGSSKYIVTSWLRYPEPEI